MLLTVVAEFAPKCKIASGFYFDATFRVRTFGDPAATEELESSVLAGFCPGCIFSVHGSPLVLVMLVFPVQDLSRTLELYCGSSMYCNAFEQNPAL